MQDKDDLCKFRDKQKDIERYYGELGKNLADSYADYVENVEGGVFTEQDKEDMVRSHIEHAVSHYHHDRAKKELE